MTSQDLEGRLALITGGASGIGLAVARRLAASGAHIALADLDEAGARSAAATLAAQGATAIGLAVDVADPGSVARLAHEVAERAGSVEILINSAGIMGRVAPLWEQTFEDWQRVISVDLTSVFLVSRAFLPPMRTRRRGCIVSLSSIAGKEGTPQLVPYSVAKAGIIAFTKALGKEVVDDGIRVNCVAPGVIQTPLLQQLSATDVATMLGKVPMRRFGTVEEVANVVHFLVSDAASFITAQCLDASGGRATY